MKITSGLIAGSVLLRGDADGDAPTKKVLLIGGIHGNEPSGVHAVQRLAFEAASGGLTIRPDWEVTLLTANALALAHNKRCLTHNMNRLMRDDYCDLLNRSGYEFKRAQEIKRLINWCDVLLDLHATSTDTEPHLLLEPCDLPTFRPLGIRKIMTGWAKVAGCVTCGTTEEYARSKGKVAATLETGWIKDPEASTVGYAACINLLTSLGAIDDASQGWCEPDAPEVYAIERMHVKRSNDFRFLIQDPKGFQRLNAGEAFAEENGKRIIACRDEYLLMPTPPTRVALGEEVFFIGRRVE